MRREPKTNSVASEPFEVDARVNSLARIGHALALSIEMNSTLLRPCDAEEALQMLVAIQCFFALTREEKVSNRALIEAILDLHNVASILHECYPDLKARVFPVVDGGTGSVLTYYDCPF